MPLSTEEFKYYQRQLILDTIQLDGQQKIKSTSVLIVGAGGLGCPLLLMCSGLGFQNIGLVDFDTISIHNLHRQYLYDYSEIDKPKVEIATQKITPKNPFVKIHTYHTMIDETNAENIIQNYDIIADGTDNFTTRYLINDTCVKLNKPLVLGSIFQFSCQAALLNYQGSKDLRAIFPEPPPPDEAPSCAEAGVANTTTTFCASLMAQILLLASINKAEHLKNKLLVAHLLNFEIKSFKY